jgi:hypothetical protein
MHTKDQLSELGERAQKLYQQLRPTVETPDQIGKTIAVDLDSGDYEIDEALIAAYRRLKQRRPAGELFGLRIGYRGVESFAGVRGRSR